MEGATRHIFTYANIEYLYLNSIDFIKTLGEENLKKIVCFCKFVEYT